MITFSSPKEAHAAFKSTEAVLNNRFIRVMWHHDNKDGRGQTVKDRLGPANNQSGAPAKNPEEDSDIAVNTATKLIKKPVMTVDPLKRPDTREEMKAKVCLLKMSWSYFDRSGLRSHS